MACPSMGKSTKLTIKASYTSCGYTFFHYNVQKEERRCSTAAVTVCIAGQYGYYLTCLNSNQLMIFNSFIPKPFCGILPAL